MNITEVAIKDVLIGERLRSVDSDYVALLASSISENGLRQPIEVRKSKGGDYILVSGGHRFEAVSAAKKNLKIKLRNPVTGNKLMLKIGEWSPSNKITLKAYATDRTLIRETTATTLWRQMHAHPSGLLAPESAYRYWDATDLGMHMNAAFSTDGFPCELWHNGAFAELCVWRSRTGNSDYLMDGSNRRHILVQPQHAVGIWTQTWNGRDWAIQSPDIEGYNDQDDITSLAPDIQAACQTFFAWMHDCIERGTLPPVERDSFLHLRSWLD